MFPLEAVTTIGGLVLPPLFDLLKKVFVKPGADTPEATLSALATTKPEVLPQFVEAQQRLLQARTLWFNRDVVGQVSPWVADLRACIRPLTVILCMVLLGLGALGGLELAPSVRASLLFMVSSWFGGRLGTGR
jgi:hypothetical protein